VTVWGAAAVSEAEFRIEGLDGAVTSLAVGSMAPAAGAGADGDLLVFVGAENGGVAALRSAPDGGGGATAAGPASAAWSVTRGRGLHDADVRAVVALGDGVWASAGLDGRVCVWSTPTFLGGAFVDRVLPAAAPAGAPVAVVVRGGGGAPDGAVLVRAAGCLQLWTLPPPLGEGGGGGGGGAGGAAAAAAVDPTLVLEVVARGMGGVVGAAAAADDLSALAAAGAAGAAVYCLERVGGDAAAPLVVGGAPAFVVVPAVLDAAATAAAAGARRLAFVGGGRAGLVAIAADGLAVHLLLAVGGDGGDGGGDKDDSGDRAPPAYRLAGSWSIDEAVAARGDDASAPTVHPGRETAFTTLAVGACAAGPLVALADTGGGVALLCVTSPLAATGADGGPRRGRRPAATLTAVRVAGGVTPVSAAAIDAAGGRLAAVTTGRRVRVFAVVGGRLGGETAWSAAYAEANPLRRAGGSAKSAAPPPPFAAAWLDGPATAGGGGGPRLRGGGGGGGGGGDGGGGDTLVVGSHDRAVALIMGPAPPPGTPSVGTNKGAVRAVRDRAVGVVLRSAAGVGATGRARRARAWDVPGGEVVALGTYANVLSVGVLAGGGDVAVVERPTKSLVEYLPAVLPRR